MDREGKGMDKKAKQILFQTYWSSDGWKDRRSIAFSDFAYAKEKGLMFDDLTISHDECVGQIVQLRDSISPESVAGAFLSSLSARRLDWRSGIASYHVAKRIPTHKFAPMVSFFRVDGRVVPRPCTCRICENAEHGHTEEERYVEADLNVLNFERIKWGGVRHGDLLYTLFDLEQFKREQIPDPKPEDIEIFKGILAAIRSCKAADFPGVLRNKLKEIPGFKSNQNERFVLLEILACIGILKPASYDRTISSMCDWRFVKYWRGEDGYDAEAVDRYFGSFL